MPVPSEAMYYDPSWPSNLVGMTVPEAKRWLANNSKKYTKVRAVLIDGKAQIVTMDYRLDRINVSVREGKIYALLKAG